MTEDNKKFDLDKILEENPQLKKAFGRDENKQSETIKEPLKASNYELEVLEEMRKQTQSLESIRSNMNFFFIITVLSLVVGALIVLAPFLRS